MVIRISRHGMTRCLSCDRHIRLEAVVHETTCPFCGSALTGGTEATRKSGLLGRTGNALAASLVSLGLGSACLDEGQRPSNDTIDTSDTTDAADTNLTDTGPDAQPDADLDTMPQPVYGLPMDIVDADDTLPQPEYGLPMEDVSDASDNGSTEDVPFMPLYGGPPADTVEPAEDVMPQPEYGLPMEDVSEPSEDAQDVNDAQDTKDDEVVPVPLYGLPPE